MNTCAIMGLSATGRKSLPTLRAVEALSMPHRNIEQRRAYARSYYAAHIEKMREDGRVRYAKNLEKERHRRRGRYDKSKLRPIVSLCESCGEEVIAGWKRRFCSPCREKGLHRKDVYSVCDVCGEKIPGKYYRKYCNPCWRRTLRLYRGTPRKKDANQNEIVADLEARGCSVIDASSVGGGFPDLVVGVNNVSYLFEIKNPLTKNKLNDLQKSFFDSWRGQADVIYSAEDALKIMGIL